VHRRVRDPLPVHPARSHRYTNVPRLGHANAGAEKPNSESPYRPTAGSGHPGGCCESKHSRDREPLQSVESRSPRFFSTRRLRDRCAVHTGRVRYERFECICAAGSGASTAIPPAEHQRDREQDPGRYSIVAASLGEGASTASAAADVTRVAHRAAVAGVAILRRRAVPPRRAIRRGAISERPIGQRSVGGALGADQERRAGAAAAEHAGLTQADDAVHPVRSSSPVAIERGDAQLDLPADLVARAARGAVAGARRAVGTAVTGLALRAVDAVDWWRGNDVGSSARGAQERDHRQGGCPSSVTPRCRELVG
jgi:hypothetical protein